MTDRQGGRPHPPWNRPVHPPLQPLLRRLAFAAFALSCLAIAGHAFAYLYQGWNPRNPFHVGFATAGWPVPAHFFAAGLALVLAPVQYLSGLRRRWPRLHRASGWLYVAAVLIGGVSGLLLAPRAQGGPANAFNFAVLSLLWLAFTGLAIRHAIAGRLEAHRRWMLRSIALTFAAVTLRVYLGLGIAVLGLPFDTAYLAAAWLCWPVNLLVCEWLLRGPLRSAAGRPPAFRPAAA